MGLAAFDAEREIGNADPVQDFEDFLAALAAMVVFFVDPEVTSLSDGRLDEDVRGRAGEVGLKGGRIEPWAGLVGAGQQARAVGDNNVRPAQERPLDPPFLVVAHIHLALKRLAPVLRRQVLDEFSGEVRLEILPFELAGQDRGQVRLAGGVGRRTASRRAAARRVRGGVKAFIARGFVPPLGDAVDEVFLVGLRVDAVALGHVAQGADRLEQHCAQRIVAGNHPGLGPVHGGFRRGAHGLAHRDAQRLVRGGKMDGEPRRFVPGQGRTPCVAGDNAFTSGKPAGL